MCSNTYVACPCGPTRPCSLHSPIWPWLCGSHGLAQKPTRPYGPHGPIAQAYESHTASPTIIRPCHALVSCAHDLAHRSYTRVLSHCLLHRRPHARVASTDLFFDFHYFSFSVFSGTHLVHFCCLLNPEITNTEINQTQVWVRFEKCDSYPHNLLLNAN